MALFVKKKEISQITAYGKTIAVIYAGGQKIWEAIRSCFGSGMWVGAKPWLYNEGWKETKRH